jgi:hypothetical protein
MKTWKDLESHIKKQWVAMINVSSKIQGHNKKTQEEILFEYIISQNPELINEYKHLLDSESLKRVIGKYPQTKIYLK